MLESVRAKMRIQTLAEMRTKKLDRDITEVRRMINEYLARNPKRAGK